MTDKERLAPRMSLSKLAEYMVATPARRRTIVRDQKFPKAFRAAQYTEAYKAIAAYFARGLDRRVLDGYLSDWGSRTPSTEFEAQNLALWCDAAVAMLDLAEEYDFSGFQYAAIEADEYLTVAGVSVSIRPEIAVTDPGRGAVKIYLGKTYPLTSDDRRPGSGSYAATMLHRWVEERHGSVLPKHCLVLDVFGCAVYEAPKAYRRRRDDVDAACEEIAIRWPAVSDS